MKKLIITVTAIGLLVGTRVIAQGDVQFDSVTGTPAWSITDSSGALVGANSPIRAELWWAAGNNAPVNSLQGSGVFASGADWFGGGQFFKGVVTLPGGPGAGAAITLQVRAWDPSSGATWTAALSRGQNPGTANYVLGGGINLPGAINGLGSFQLSPIPEPSTLALIGLGTGALLFLRRRK